MAEGRQAQIIPDTSSPVSVVPEIWVRTRDRRHRIWTRPPSAATELFAWVDTELRGVRQVLTHLHQLAQTELRERGAELRERGTELREGGREGGRKGGREGEVESAPCARPSLGLESRPASDRMTSERPRARSLWTGWTHLSAGKCLLRTIQCNPALDYSYATCTRMSTYKLYILVHTREYISDCVYVLYGDGTTLLVPQAAVDQTRHSVRLSLQHRERGARGLPCYEGERLERAGLGHK